MYDHSRQYRCTIIRGKSKSEMDDLLLAYAQILDGICPCQKEDFDLKFNSALIKYLPGSSKKTLDNHRTEVVGKLFGMYYHDSDGNVYTSERTKKYLQDNDQPAFFKDICFKMQFPNGMDKAATIIERKDNNISIRQYPFLIKTLLRCKEKGLYLNKNDIGYYILNSLDVLQGVATPDEVVDAIEHDRDLGVIRKVSYSGKASSYNMQHITEQINYLELANLVIIGNSNEVVLNVNEMDTINYFASYWDKRPEFDVYLYDLNTVENRKEISYKWDLYFGKVSSNSEKFETTTASLGITMDQMPNVPNTSGTTSTGRTDLTVLGDEGEAYVYAYEKERVRKFNPRLVGKVLHLGKTRGLGYDIQSVIAESGELEEFVKYIEVKATKRVTAPDISDGTWVDSINLTRNEWVAAKQHKDFYSIYRVYFVRGKVLIHVIKDVHNKVETGAIKLAAISYRADFGNSAVDYVINEQN